MKNLPANVCELEDRRLATANLVPGVRVYGEDLVQVEGREYRTWDPTRSKLAAFLLKGGRVPLSPTSTVLYLGAANGTTVSHVSDIVERGVVVAVEISPRSFRDLLLLAQSRPNLVPILQDARRPSTFRRYLPQADLVYQDIAQRNQGRIFASALAEFSPPWGLLMVKARSIRVEETPRSVYESVGREVESLVPYERVEVLELSPFVQDHAAIVFRKRGRGEGKGRRGSK